MINQIKNALVVIAVLMLAGCGSAYKGVTDSSGLGSAQYTPAVLVESGAEGRYPQVLTICRDVAQKRQMTAAQESQLKTLTRTVEGAVTGAAVGIEFGGLLDALDSFGVSTSDAALAGAAAGALIGVAGAFAEGAQKTASETRKVLLTCLDKTGQNGELWTVLEDY